MDSKEITRLLNRYEDGDAEALALVSEIVYAQLRKIARNYLKGEGRAHTLQPTALVNEAFIRLLGGQKVEWKNRAHFFRLAAMVMRRILVDHARQKDADKRGAGVAAVPFDEELHLASSSESDVLAIDHALTALAEMSPKLAQVAELRYFAGLSIEETAEAMNISPTTVKRDWVRAKVWLSEYLTNKD